MPVSKLKVESRKSKTSTGKTVKKAVLKTADPKVASKASGLTIEAYGITGKVVEKITLPKEIFGGKINNPLMAQAVRIYLANQRMGTASTKTRGEVEGSSRKIYKQKGTGRARHGSIRANIFVKGGIVFGPKPRDFGLNLPKKMKKAAVASALSSKLKDGEIKVLSGFEKLEPKTKKMVQVLNIISPDYRKLLLVTSGDKKDNLENLYRASKNIKGLEILSASLLNTYEVLNSTGILLTKQAVEALSKSFSKEK